VACDVPQLVGVEDAVGGDDPITVGGDERGPEHLPRSVRISNRKLREVSGWRPRYPSAREGWKATVDTIQGAGIADRPARARASR
jgi:hypothetical protein